jgi:hypothetical protein
VSVVNVASSKIAFRVFWETVKSEAKTLTWHAIPFADMTELFQEIQATCRFSDNRDHSRKLTIKERQLLAGVHSMLGIYSVNLKKSKLPKHFFISQKTQSAKHAIPNANPAEREGELQQDPNVQDSSQQSAVPNGSQEQNLLTNLNEQQKEELSHYVYYPNRKVREPMTYVFRMWSQGKGKGRNVTHGKDLRTRDACMLEILKTAQKGNIPFPGDQFEDHFVRQTNAVTDVTVEQLKSMRAGETQEKK